MRDLYSKAFWQGVWEGYSQPWVPIAMAYRAWQCRSHGHRWVEHDGNSFKRRCECCGRVEWLFKRPFPSETEPSLSWQEMDNDRAARSLERSLKKAKP